MKTISKSNALWPRTLAQAATVVAIIAPAFSALCVPSDTLLITENSDTSLTVSWNGSSITPILLANDHWDFTLPVTVHLGSGEGSFGSPDGAAILEPGAGSSGPWNNVFTSTTLGTPYVNLVDVQSDSSTTSGFATTLADGVAGAAGTDSSGTTINITFHDAGDTTGSNSVPDGAPTILLILMSFTIIFGWARFRGIKAV